MEPLRDRDRISFWSDRDRDVIEADAGRAEESLTKEDDKRN